jgi:hypothetical protein
MGLLDTQIADAIYKGFKGKLLNGVIRQVVTPASGSLDELGDPQAGDPIDTDCQGFTENYSAYHRAQAGIPQTDLKVNLFARSMPGITPSKDAVVKFVRAGVDEWYQLRGPREIDPAGALWVCQAFALPQEPYG